VTEQRTSPTRHVLFFDRLGGEPGRFTVSAIAFAVVWFPIRLYLDHGDPIAAIIASSGLHGMVWAWIPLSIEWLQPRLSRRRPAVRTEPPSRSYVRRGAIVGLAAGVPFYGALIALCLITGRSRVYPASFVVLLAIIIVVAAVRLRRAA
jgi:hypothetical protein